MARKRMIDPGFWNDEKLGTCTRDERLLFMGLISNADDEGRLQGHPSLLRSIIFPYDNDLTPEQVKVWLDGLNNKQLIQIYQVNNQTYILIPNFHKHQTINKPTKSTLPVPLKTTTAPLPEDYSSPTALLPPNRREEKIKEEKEKEVEENAREDAAAAADKELIKSIQTILQDSGILSPSLTEVAEIYRWLKEQKWDIDMFAQAAKDMALGNKRQVKYITKIFNRWSDSGFKTLADVLADKDEFERRKLVKKPAHSPPKGNEGKYRLIQWGNFTEENLS